MLDGADRNVVAGELEGQEPHSIGLFLRRSKLPFARGIVREAREIFARPGVFHERGEDVA